MSAPGFSPLPLKHIEGKVVLSPLRDLDKQYEPQHPETNRMHELEQMLNEAQGRAAIVEREAYDKAYSAGEQAGMDLGRKRAEQMTDVMASVLLQCEKSAKRLHERMDEVVLDIANSVIRHIIDTMLEEHPEYMKQMIDQATCFIPKQDSLSLAVSVQDMAMFERLLDDTPNKLIADDTIAPGTCRIMASEHDILIDPQAAISECMQHIRSKLLQQGPRQTGSDDADSPES